MPNSTSTNRGIVAPQSNRRDQTVQRVITTPKKNTPFIRVPFTLRVRDFNGYTMYVEVVDSPYGRMRQPEVVYFSPELLLYLSKLGNPNLNGKLENEELMAMGQMIGDMLFPTQARRLFLQTMKQAYYPREGRGIRVLLELDDEQLAVIPWEYAYLQEFKFLRHREMMDFQRDLAYLQSKEDWTEEEITFLIDYLLYELNEYQLSTARNWSSEEHKDAVREALRGGIDAIQEKMRDENLGFLGLDDHLSIVRYEPYADLIWTGTPEDLEEVEPKENMNIFFCASDPIDLGALNVSGEAEAIAAGLKGSGRDIRGDSRSGRTESVRRAGGDNPLFNAQNIHEVFWGSDITKAKLKEELNKEQTSHIFHFSGHAGYISRSSVSKEGQVYAVVANHSHIDEKPSQEDLAWERRMVRVLSQVLSAPGNGFFKGDKFGYRDIKNASDPLRDIKNASDPLRDIKNASDPLRDIKNASDPLRDIKNASDPLRGIMQARRNVHGLNADVFEALDRKEGVLVLEKEATSHWWQDKDVESIENIIKAEAENIERATLAGLEPAKPLYEFIFFLQSLLNNDDESVQSGDNALDNSRKQLLAYFRQVYTTEVSEGNTWIDHPTNTLDEPVIASLKGNFENLWNKWILPNAFWSHKDMGHELMQASLRWRAGSHDVLWASELADLLKDKGIKLVVLNSCKTAQSDSRSFEAAGVATTLIQAGIPAVIGMQLSLDDEAAIKFSSTFYDALAEGYRLEEALVKGRRAMFNMNISQYWGVPTLYMRQMHVADTFQLCKYEEDGNG